MFLTPSPCLRRFLLVWAALKHQVGKREYNASPLTRSFGFIFILSNNIKTAACDAFPKAGNYPAFLLPELPALF